MIRSAVRGWKCKVAKIAKIAGIAGAQHQQVGAQLGDIGRHLSGGAAADGHHGNHCTDADDNAEHRQERPQRIDAYRLQRELEGFAEHQPVCALRPSD